MKSTLFAILWIIYSQFLINCVAFYRGFFNNRNSYPQLIHNFRFFMKKVLAFDIGGTNTRLALINENFEIEKVEIKDTPHNSKEKFMETVFELVDAFPLEDVVAFGAGVPGVVDTKSAKIITLPNVGISDIEFGKLLKEKYHLDVYLRNDAQMACLAEATLGKGKDYGRVFFVTISTGLGGSLCVNGEIQDYLTEVGHTLFKYKDSYQEFEIAAGANIAKLAKLNNVNISSAKEMFDKVKAKDEEGLRFFEEWKNIIKQYFVLMNDSYCPDVFVVTGGFMKSKAYFFDEIKQCVDGTPIVECSFDQQAGLMGSALYAIKKTNI